MSRVTNLLGCTYPIVQGAMGVICNPEFVAAVSEAGGFGLLATAFAKDPEKVRAQVRATNEHTSKPFGANLHVMNPRAFDFAQVLADEGIKAVTISGGSPKDMIPFCHERDIKVMIVVPTAKFARQSEEIGADAIVAEGSESGGMQGFGGPSTMVLVPMVVDSVKVPVLAAGGIAESRGFKAALALGAEGVQIGTRFIATKECIAHQNYKDTIVNASETGTGLLNLGRFQLRALKTPFVDKALSGEQMPASGFVGADLEESWIKGNLDSGALPAGQVAGMIQNIPSVKEIINEIISGSGWSDDD
jgi:enoyl-[acyl-carrier protein] reductase II